MKRKKKERLCCLGYLWGEGEFKCRFGVTVIFRFGTEAYACVFCLGFSSLLRAFEWLMSNFAVGLFLELIFQFSSVHQLFCFYPFISRIFCNFLVCLPTSILKIRRQNLQY